jgi:hypothetical protein
VEPRGGSAGSHSQVDREPRSTAAPLHPRVVQRSST